MKKTGLCCRYKPMSDVKQVFQVMYCTSSSLSCLLFILVSPSFVPVLKDYERFLSRSQDLELQLSSKEKELEQLFQKQRGVSERWQKDFPQSALQFSQSKRKTIHTHTHTFFHFSYPTGKFSCQSSNTCEMH